ncbi:MAG: ABC transporter permease [Candidatus Levybacteria bacterium]|nr:ABC transporter permease [Candidatus Levybacteria bacterium]
MSRSRIYAIIIQELFITRNSLEVIIDLFYFSIINIVAFGFVSVFLTSRTNPIVAHYLLTGMILWEIIRVTQYSISVGALWNIWSRNLSNMFVAPLTLKEYMVAAMISGGIKSVLILIAISLIAKFMFSFDIFALGMLNLFFYFINLTIFAWTAGIIILGLIFRFGTRIQALAWGLIFLFQPLTAVFFPVKILPDVFQKIAYFLPPTYIFEAARINLTNPTTQTEHISIAFLQNIIYLLVSLLFFNYMFTKSRKTGQFAKNEG